MTVFNLEHFPNVCRVCLKSESSKLHSLDENFETIRMQIKTFLEEAMFRPTKDKDKYLPKFVCDACLKQLTEFAIYRSRLALTHRFMEALVDLKHSNSKPLTALFKKNKAELDALFKELSLCSKSEPQVEDLLQEFDSYKFESNDAPVKVEKREHSESEDDDVRDDPSFECPDELVSEIEIKPDILYLTEPNTSKPEVDDSSSDDEPLVKKKRVTKPKASKPKPARSATSTTAPPAENDGPKKIGRPRLHAAGRHLEEPWSCDKCKFVTKYRIAVKRHKLVHERREVPSIPCDMCEMKFKTKAELRKHEKVHPEKQVVMCEICGASLKSGTAMKAHMERHEDKRKYQCDYCDYAAYTPIGLKAHLKNHTTESKHKCDICQASFKKSNHLKRHLEIHSDVRKYACEQCPARFRTKSAYKQHFQRLHLGGIRFPCEYCDRTFDQRIILRDHIERVHHIQCQFICDICVVIFDAQEKLDVHRQRHENPKTLECPVCLTIHPDQEAFNGHLCITYREDYMCCNKDLRNHGQYNRHMLIKHGLKTNARVKPIPGVLVGNMRGSRKRLMQCRKCDIAFPTKALKEQHMMMCSQSAAAQQMDFSNSNNSAAMHVSY